MNPKRKLLSLGAFGILLALVSGNANANVFTTQPACVTGAGYCSHFDAKSVFPTTVRSISFQVTSPGAALVNFNGSMFCQTGGASLFDLSSQIVDALGTRIGFQGPGGLRHASLTLYQGTGGTLTFNLTSTRLFRYSSVGTKTIYFRIANRGTDPDFSCSVYSAVFTVEFVPNK